MCVKVEAYVFIIQFATQNCITLNHSSIATVPRTKNINNPIQQYIHFLRAHTHTHTMCLQSKGICAYKSCITEKPVQTLKM